MVPPRTREPSRQVRHISDNSSTSFQRERYGIPVMIEANGHELITDVACGDQTIALLRAHRYGDSAVGKTACYK